MKEQCNWAEKLASDKRQLINYFSVEISERLCEHPSEIEIVEVEKVLNEFTAMLLNHNSKSEE